MIRSLENKWRALPPDRELLIRQEVLAEMQRALDEAKVMGAAAAPNSRESRVASQTVSYFLSETARVQGRIDELQALIADNSADVLAAAARRIEDEAREKNARQRARLRKNSKLMLKRFLVVTPEFNDEFLAKLGVKELGDLDVDAALRVVGIRLVSLDNPERWTPGGESVSPQKLFGLHPSDVSKAMKVLNLVVSMPAEDVPEEERAERATIVWLPRQTNGFQHPDPERTTYPPKYTRVALDHRNNVSPKGWAVLRAWGLDLDTAADPLNSCEVDFDAVPKKGRFEAALDPVEVEEILL